MARLKGSLSRKKKQFCVNGHDTFVCGRTSSRACRECVKDIQKRHEETPKRKVYRKKYRQTEKYKNYHREYDWAFQGILNSNGKPFTIEDYNIAYMKQEGKCAICGVPENIKSESFHVDHNHVTGFFRGLLCGECNRLLGLAKDNLLILKNAITYLS